MIDEITTKPIWVDLKGKDSVPETVHHVIFRVDPTEPFTIKDNEVAIHKKAQAEPVTDGVHASRVGGGSGESKDGLKEVQSRITREVKVSQG